MGYYTIDGVYVENSYHKTLLRAQAVDRYIGAGLFLGGFAYDQFKSNVPFKSDQMPLDRMINPPVKRSYNSGIKAGQNEQYVSTVRHHSSKFGRKKRYTLKRARREINSEQFQLISRFHTFVNDGFQQGLGGQNLSYTKVTEVAGPGLAVFFPFIIYDVTSLPTAESPYGNGCYPIRGYQLIARNVSAGNTDAEIQKFGWVPRLKTNQSVSHMIMPSGTAADDWNIAVPVESQGHYKHFKTMQWASNPNTHAPHAQGFTHNWSDIKMVMYPQTELPCVWHVALVSFPDSIIERSDADVSAGEGEPLQTAGPQGYYMQSSSANLPEAKYATEGYSGQRFGQSNSEKNLDNRWQKFWSGKLLNPINRDISGAGTLNPTDNRLPFKIIKHESFYQPPRDHVAFGGKAQRLIKKLFYRREWTFSSTRSYSQAPQGDAINQYNTVQVRKERATNENSSPFPEPQEKVFLAVWCEHYKAREANVSVIDSSGTVDAPLPEFPSFDIVVKMKHTISQTQNEDHNVDVVPKPDNPVTAMLVSEPEPIILDEPVKKTRSKKKSILDGTERLETDTSGLS